MTLDLKVDTGSQANLMHVSAYRKLQIRIPLARNNCILRSYAKGVNKHLCTMVTVGSKTAKIDFFLVKKDRQAILGLQASELLELFLHTANE